MIVCYRKSSSAQFEWNKSPNGPSTPSCEDGGQQFSLTLSERMNAQTHCGSCGTRFPTKVGAEKVVLPKHNIPLAVHEYRLKLEADGVKLD